jgi:hypothetical protein
MRAFIYATIFVILTGCVTGELVQRINPGMSQEEVVKVLGKPDGFKQSGDYTVYKYTNRLISGWSWDRADYSFIFKGNSLIEYGAGEVREKNVGGVHTLFIHQL